MKWNRNTIIGCIVIVLIVIIIAIFLLRKNRQDPTPNNPNLVSGYVWIPLPPSNSLFAGQKPWDINPFVRIFRLFNQKSSLTDSTNSLPSLEDYYNVMTFKTGDGFSANVSNYTEFYEMCFYSYPELALIKTIPYPIEVKLRCDQDLVSGSYIIILRCKGDGSSSWSTKPFLGKGKIKESSIIQSRSIIIANDESYHEKLGDEYQSIAINRQDIPTRNVVSEQNPIYPLSKFIIRESMTLSLKPEENAIIIFPNRSKTLNCEDSIFIDGIKMEGNRADLFNSFEIEGARQSSSTLSQIIYGNGSQDYLPFYAYIHSLV